MTYVLLFATGLLGGMINSLAGGGSFVIFPALLFAGVPPVLANASNTYACLPGYVTGAIGYWKHIAPHRGRLALYSTLGLVGGFLGAEALMRISDEAFSIIIPWLMAFAVAIYIFGQRINRFFAARSVGSKRAARAGAIGLSVLLLAISFYGGFFNAGLGIVLAGAGRVRGRSCDERAQALDLGCGVGGGRAAVRVDWVDCVGRGQRCAGRGDGWRVRGGVFLAPGAGEGDPGVCDCLWGWADGVFFLGGLWVGSPVSRHLRCGRRRRACHRGPARRRGDTGPR